MNGKFKSWLIGIIVCLPLILAGAYLIYLWIGLMVLYGPPALIGPVVVIGVLILSYDAFANVGAEVRVKLARRS